MTINSRVLTVHWQGYDTTMQKHFSDHFVLELNLENAICDDLGAGLYYTISEHVSSKSKSIKELDYVEIYEGVSKILGYQSVLLIEDQNLIDAYLVLFNKNLHEKLFSELKGTCALRLLIEQAENSVIISD